MATRKQDQPPSNEQSGSTGRYTGADKLDQSKNTGQDRYGQSGLGGKVDSETIGQRKYKKGKSGGEQSPPEPSNRGSGTADDESEKKRRP